MDDQSSLVKLAEARLADRAAKQAQQAAASGPKYCSVHKRTEWCRHNGGVRGVNGFGPPGTETADDSMKAFIAWLRVQIDEDERAAKEMKRAFPTPWELADRGWMVRIVADSPHLREVVRLEQQFAPDGCAWLSDVVEHVWRQDPDRTLREVQSKRRILDEVVPEINAMDDRIEDEWGSGNDAPREETWLLLKIMGLPYADRDGLREEWKP